MSNTLPTREEMLRLVERLDDTGSYCITDFGGRDILAASKAILALLSALETMTAERDAARETIRQANARVAELEAALKPFAEVRVCSLVPEEHPILFDVVEGQVLPVLTWANISRARAALKDGETK